MTASQRTILFTITAATIGIMGGVFTGFAQTGSLGSIACGACHAPQKTAYDAHTHAASKGPGTDVVPNETGIGCESCHGPGQAHVMLGVPKLEELAKEKGDLQLITGTSSELCGACHGRLDDDTIDLTADYLIANMQSYNELSKSMKPQFKVTCVACHSPHVTSTVPEGIVRKCTVCHMGKYSVEVNIPAMSALACEDCHMPFAVSDGEGTMVEGYLKGEHRSHIFGISVYPDYRLNDGSNKAALNGDSLARLTIEMTCYACHRTGVRPPLPDEQLFKAAAEIH